MFPINFCSIALDEQQCQYFVCLIISVVSSQSLRIWKQRPYEILCSRCFINAMIRYFATVVW